METIPCESEKQNMNKAVPLLLALFSIGFLSGLPQPAPAVPPAKAASSALKPSASVDTKRPLILIDAASNGDIQAVRSLLAQGQDVNARDSDGNTPLMAVLNNRTKPMSQVFHGGLSDAAYAGVVRLLLAHGADVNTRSHEGMTPLMINLCNGHADVVPLLIAHGADVNTSNGLGVTPLMYALTEASSESEQLPLVTLLLKHGASPNALDTRGRTALRLAAAQSSLLVVRLLLAHGARDDGSAAADAAFVGRTDTVQVLLQNEKDIRERRRRATLALRAAVNQGNTEITKPVIKYLAEHGADLEVKGFWGWTPFMTKVYDGQLDMVDYFLDHGANINAVDDQGHTALWHAREWLIGPPKPSESEQDKDLRQVARHLLERGANVNACDSYGKTMLYEAAETGDLSALSFWVEHDSDVNKPDKNGQSPLAVALVLGHNAAASLLIGHGAEVNSRDKFGLMPLHFALQNLTESLKAGEPDVVPALVARGADVNAPGRLNSPPLEILEWSRPVPPPPGCAPAEEARFDQVNAESLSDMRLLIAHGADVNNWNNWTSKTLLQLALYRKDADASRILIGAGEKK